MISLKPRICAKQGRNPPQFTLKLPFKINRSISNGTFLPHSLPTTTTTDSNTVDLSNVWASFSSAVAGEWEGITATFNARTGQPRPLPEYYVPQAYRDWGVELFDWQSQCSCNVDQSSDGSSGLSTTSRRMMPTVGCEADAIAFTEESQLLFSSTSCSQATITADGAYTCGPDVDLTSQDPAVAKATLEVCIPVGNDVKKANKPQRIRVIFVLKRVSVDSNWYVEGIMLHKERWDAPFNGRRELAGCGGGMDPMAQGVKVKLEKELSPSSLKWKVVDGVVYESGSVLKEVEEGRAWDMVGESEEEKDGWVVVGLPLGCWAAWRVGDERSVVEVEVGVVLKEGKLMRVGKRKVSDAVVVEASMLSLKQC